jgi:hypothetical protein
MLSWLPDIPTAVAGRYAEGRGAADAGAEDGGGGRGRRHGLGGHTRKYIRLSPVTAPAHNLWLYRQVPFVVSQVNRIGAIKLQSVPSTGVLCTLTF